MEEDRTARLAGRSRAVRQTRGGCSTDFSEKGTMAGKKRSRSHERAKTDDSLRTERAKTDDALKGDRASAARGAQGVVDEARTVADAVVRTARRKVDDAPAARDRDPAAVARERKRADRVVGAERAAADQVLEGDIEDRADALNALLVHERAATDAFLLTERARSDDAVENRDDFLGMVAHDVRNLLNLVVLSLELLRPRDEAEPDPQVAATADRIRRYVARMNRLVGDLVDVTSIDAGRLAVHPKECDAATLVEEATETFQAVALAKGVTLSAALPGRPLLALFDHDRMLQVASNVLSNAIKFTPRGGTVRFAAGEADGIIRLSVSDTGVGIPASALQAIFERFWQVGTDDRRGMGLGLYISKCIVAAHGGRIWAESEPGKGSEVCFTLPLPAGNRRSRESGPGPRTRRRRDAAGSGGPPGPAGRGRR